MKKEPVWMGGVEKHSAPATTRDRTKPPADDIPERNEWDEPPEADEVVKDGQLPTNPSETPTLYPHSNQSGEKGPGVVMMSGLPEKKAEFHWTKASVKYAGRTPDGSLLAFDSDKGERFCVRLKKLEGKIGAPVYENLLGVVKGGPRRLHVRWTLSDGGARFIVDALDDDQYRAALADKNRHRKMMRHGFQTQDPWMT